MSVSDERRASLLAEAEYKEQMAEDLKREGAWQEHLHREAAAKLREEADGKA